MLRQPADDLDSGAILRRVVAGGDIRVQLRGERPRLRSCRLDEPHRPVILSQPTLRDAGVGSRPATHAS
jgi:hypothetical protein